MARYAFERLSAQDASFLWAEQPNQPMHVGAVAILESGPLRLDDGGIDIARYRGAVEGVLHWIPRYRQRIEWTPIEGWPVWVDDRQFDLGYHIRHIGLPKPGTLAQLKELAARINARPLDRQHPLWEIWVVEGLDGGEQFALLNKVHHCMIDGAAGADLSQILMSPSQRAEPVERVPYMPRPVPSRSELFRDSVSESVRRPLSALRSVGERNDPRREVSAPTKPRAARASGGGTPGLSRRLGALKEMLTFAMHPASDTPLNGSLGPHRRLDWLTMPLDDVREISRVLHCTVNDVILATVTGAVRRYLFRRRVDHRSVDFRVAAPVSTRRPEHDRRQGNHVSSWIVPLPVEFDEPIDRVRALRERTEALKESEAALAVDTIMQLFEWIPAPVVAKATALARGPANMIVTNVPGPQFPLYIVGARLLGMYPLVPLLPGGGLGIAMFSYEGKMCWGFNGDYELVPDLGTFVDDICVSFEELRRTTVEHYLARRTAEVDAADDAGGESIPVMGPPEVNPAKAKRRRAPKSKKGPGATSPPTHERAEVVAPAELANSG